MDQDVTKVTICEGHRGEWFLCDGDGQPFDGPHTFTQAQEYLREMERSDYESREQTKSELE